MKRGVMLDKIEIEAWFDGWREEIEEDAKSKGLLINDDQLEKFFELFAFILSKADLEYDTILPVEYNTETGSFDACARFIIFLISGNEEVKDFCRVFNECSEFHAEFGEDEGIYLRFTIPNVFRKAIRLVK